MTTNSSLPPIGTNTITTGMFTLTLPNIRNSTTNDEEDEEASLTPEERKKLDELEAEIKKQQATMATPIPTTPPLHPLKELPIIEGEEHSYGVKKSCDITTAFAINNWIREHQTQGWYIHWSTPVMTREEDMMYLTQQVLMTAPKEFRHLPLWKPVRMVYCCLGASKKDQGVEIN